MQLKITILEDKQIEIERLTNELLSWSKEKDTQLDINTYSSGEEYFNLRKVPEDSNIIFLDIQMDKMSGIDVARQIRSEGYSGYIIFLTAFREYVFHGYEVHALNYLLKPIKRQPLFLCLNEVARHLEGNSYLFRNKQELIRIPYKDILCFSASLHYVDILTTTDNLCQYSTLNNIITHLPKEFIRIHRSYIVNMEHIYKLSGNTITLSNKKTVAIGRVYLKAVIADFSSYSARHYRNGEF
ncbi:MAG: response regulator transcription factor [Lachnospiraceae bacterium]|nr:response regulator transcription factor [Lachnospiraceae bacterium]